jgi:hypothetical protein
MPDKLVSLGPDYLRLPVTAKATLRAMGQICGDDVLTRCMQKLVALEEQVCNLCLIEPD